MADENIGALRQIVTVREARAAGMKKFFTGKRCKRGHITERFVTSNTCVACDRMKYHAIVEIRRPQMSAWRAKNLLSHREACRGWKKKNPEQADALARNRRARVAAAEGSHTGEQIKALAIRQQHRCMNCRVSIKNGYHADHINPIARGGSNDIRNIQLLCQPCNSHKHAKDPIRWAREHGRLL